MTEMSPKWLLVKLPDGKMVVRCESASFRHPQDDVYVMPDGTRGVIVQTLNDDADPGYGLLRDLHGSEVSTYAEEEPEDALDALGGILRVAIVQAEAAERNKWTEERAKLVAEFNETAERLLRNQSKCVLLFQESRKRDRENEKLRRKHKRATLWIQMLLGLLNGIDEAAVVKALVEMGAEFECAPLEKPTSASTPAASEPGTPPDPDPKSVETEG